MKTPDPALASVMREVAETSCSSIRIIHPGGLRGDAARRAFEGLTDETIDMLEEGEPHVSIESEDLSARIEREIATRLIRNAADPDCWVAFATPEGDVEFVLPMTADPLRAVELNGATA